MTQVVADLTEFGLKDYAARAGVTFGCAVTDTIITGNLTELQAAVLKQASIITCENAMKRSVIEAVRGTLDYSRANG
ncbi:endo-1,4-beta-xylanase, partial [Mesorhizobium japonicum]|uniref:endo-1,4-beta-xylanase n=1 Tax=Mesorhizobium japonicum TaxID=2066070 RepID=UPI003B5A6B60